MTTISAPGPFTSSDTPVASAGPGQELGASGDHAGAPVGPELVFIEGDVGDAAALLQQMIAAGREAYLLDATQDGLALINSVLEGRSGIGALHLITHGAEGAIALGSARLDAAAVAARLPELQALGEHLSSNGDILLYGCNVASQGDLSLVRALAAATGADVAASSDITGAQRLGGDWDLEVSSGSVQAQPGIDAALAATYEQVLSLSSVTANFDTTTDFLNAGGSDNSAQDVQYKVAGDAGYVLNINGTAEGVFANEGGVDLSPWGGESLVTFSFGGGNVFTPSSIMVGNLDGLPQTLLFTGYGASGPVTHTVAFGEGQFSAAVNFPASFANLSSLTLSALSNGGHLNYVYVDDLAFSTIQSPDTTAPTVTTVTSDSASGTYKIGDTLAIKVNFSEAVTVVGIPQLTLETGTVDRIVNYSGGSGSSTLTFNYTIQAGDSSADLDYVSTAALGLGGGTIRDSAGNSAVLTLPAPGAANSLGANKSFVIDGVVPTVTSVTSTAANGAYMAGDTISIQVNFSEVVNVTGTPQLSLETGTTDRVVNYTGGTGTSTLTFSYLVQAGDTSADLDYTSAAIVGLNGGAIRDGAGNNATLTLPAQGEPGSLGANKDIVIDTTAATILGVTSSAANGAYNAGDVIAIQVNFSEAVNVTGTPQLTLETGTTDRVLNYASGSGTSSLTFNYTVQAGDTSADLDYTSAAVVALNGGTIKDAAGNGATLTLAAPGAAGSLGANKDIVIDTTAATVSGVTSSTTDGAYNTGDVIAIQVNFSEAVDVTGTPQLTLETGTTDRVVNYASGSGTSSLTFNYTVQAGDTSSDLDYFNASALALNGGTIRDAADNDATLTLASPGESGSLGASSAIVVDAVAPTVASVTSSSADGSYKIGDTISIQMVFSENVTVTGTPQLALETGTVDRAVDYVSGSGTNTLSFSYTVQAGDTSADLNYSSTSALTLNGGTIADGATNDALLALPGLAAAGSLATHKDIAIDGIVPTVIGVTSSVADGVYRVGDVIALQVNFSEAITVTGTPQLKLETGNTDRVVDYTGGSGSSTLTFTYTVQPGDRTADLDYFSSAALTLNGGTMKDAAGNDAVLSLASPGAPGSLGASSAIAINWALVRPDTMTGGEGDDVYIVDNPRDLVIEQPEAGIDQVISSVDYTLPDNVELLTLSGSRSISATGNSLDNIIVGNSGNNVLTGGMGSDTLTGALGADRFVVRSAAESSASPGEWDVIVDFSSMQRDRIDLHGIDANSAGVGRQSLVFIGSVQFSTVNATGQLRFDSATHMLYGSTDADADAEFAIELTGVTTLSAKDLIL